MCFRLVSFFANVKIFNFWPKTMDYSQEFWPKLRSFFEAFLLLTGRCYEAEIYAILLPLRCAFAWYPFFAYVKIFNFWPKTMDYSQAFWPKMRSFSERFLLLAGRCYEAEIYAILLPLRCAFAWYPFLRLSKFSISGRKPWTIVRRFGRN